MDRETGGPIAAPFALQRLGVIMRPDPTRPQEREGVLNPGAVRGPDGALYLFPRVVAGGDYSRIAIARVRCNDGGNPTGVERLGYALEPRESYELRPREDSGGCEDARVTYVEPLGLYVMAYVARGPGGARIALAVSDDLLSWCRLGLVDFTPDPDPVYGVDFDAYNNKDGAVFPRTVLGPDGRASLALLHRPRYDEHNMPRGVDDPRPAIWISYCALDDVRRDLRQLAVVRGHHLLVEPCYPWEELWIGGGVPPVLTRHGWLLIYHGVRKRPPRSPDERRPLRYSAGALILDEHDPRQIVYRSPAPVLSPRTPEEVAGAKPEAVFPTGADNRGDGRIDVYYGMADTCIGAARLRVPETLPQENNRTY